MPVFLAFWTADFWTQVWPNLAANMVWVPLAWGWSRWHRRQLRRHWAEHRAGVAADLAAHREALGSGGRHPAGPEVRT